MKRALCAAALVVCVACEKKSASDDLAPKVQPQKEAPKLLLKAKLEPAPAQKPTAPAPMEKKAMPAAPQASQLGALRGLTGSEGKMGKLGGGNLGNGGVA